MTRGMTLRASPPECWPELLPRLGPPPLPQQLSCPCGSSSVLRQLRVRLLECWLHLELLHPGLPPFCSSGISWLESRPLSQLELLHPQLPPSCSSSSTWSWCCRFGWRLRRPLRQLSSSSWPMLEWLPDSAPSQARLST